MLRLPESFPFTLSIGVADLRKHEGFNIHRQGLDMDMVALRKVRVEQPPKPAKKPRKAKAKKAEPAPSLFDRQTDEVSAVNGQQRTLADAPFAAPIAECAELVREGRFYAGIALAQAIVEAARVAGVAGEGPQAKEPTGELLKALEALQATRSSTAHAGPRLSACGRIGTTSCFVGPRRNPDSQLEATARSSLALLEEIAGEFFGHSEQHRRPHPGPPRILVGLRRGKVEEQTMWIFTKHGFFSAVLCQPGERQAQPACRSRPHHGPRPGSRGASRGPEEALPRTARRVRNPRVGGDGLRLPAVRAEVCMDAGACGLAEETDYDNFKSEVAHHQGVAGAAYERSLHDVWSVMHRLQK